MMLEEPINAAVATEAVRILAELGRRIRENNFLTFKPYPTQREAVESDKPITTMFGANQSGKSHTAAHRMTWDSLGIYPEWYEGPRTATSIDSWVVGQTNESTRDTCQKKLFGPDPNKPGEGGLIPPSKILGKPSFRHNIPGAFDTVRVEHVSGQVSTIQFKSYSMGFESLMGWTGHRIWVDEEPPWDCFSELKLRVAATKGLIFVTFTPLQGKTPLYLSLSDPTNPHIWFGWLTAEEAGHLGAEHIEEMRRLFANDPAGFRARVYGTAEARTGLVYPCPVGDLLIPRFDPEPTWLHLGALDFGWSHPTAALAAAKNPDTGDVFIFDAYRQSKLRAETHIENLRPMGLGNAFPFVCDPSAEQTEKSSGEKLLEVWNDALYGNDSWRYTPPSDRWLIKANNAVRPGIEVVQSYMDTHKLYLMEGAPEMLLEELREYRYAQPSKDGTSKPRVHKIGDDLCDCLRYLLVEIGRARPRTKRRPWTRSMPKTPHTCQRGY